MKGTLSKGMGLFLIVLLAAALVMVGPAQAVAESDSVIVIDISPIFEGWTGNAEDGYTLYWGYENRSTIDGEPYVVDVVETGIANYLVPGDYSSLLPTEFGLPNVVDGRPGRTGFGINETNAFVITDWDGVGNIVWHLNGRTATASINSEKEFTPNIDLSPIFEGWTDNGDGTHNLYFGYENKSTLGGQPYVVKPAEDEISNFITPNTHTDLLPTEFGFPGIVDGRPGRTGFGIGNNAFVIKNWDGEGNVVWNLNGKTSTGSINPSMQIVPIIDVRPIFEGWVNNGNGKYTAYFGYENHSTLGGQPYTVKGDALVNKLTPNSYNDLVPEEFIYPNIVEGRPGRTGFGVHPTNAIVISNWDGSNIVWTLGSRTATAGLAGPELTLPKEPKEPGTPVYVEPDPEEPEQEPEQPEEEPEQPEEEPEELPKTGTNVYWLIPLGLAILAAGSIFLRRILTA